jgi:hypothetical protein
MSQLWKLAWSTHQSKRSRLISVKCRIYRVVQVRNELLHLVNLLFGFNFIECLGHIYKIAAFISPTGTMETFSYQVSLVRASLNREIVSHRVIHDLILPSYLILNILIDADIKYTHVFTYLSKGRIFALFVYSRNVRLKLKTYIWEDGEICVTSMPGHCRCVLHNSLKHLSSCWKRLFPRFFDPWPTYTDSCVVEFPEASYRRRIP